jgi:hypothetical protein
MAFKVSSRSCRSLILTGGEDIKVLKQLHLCIIKRMSLFSKHCECALANFSTVQVSVMHSASGITALIITVGAVDLPSDFEVTQLRKR